MICNNFLISQIYPASPVQRQIATWVDGIKHQRSFRRQFKAVWPIFQSSHMLLGPFSVWVLTRLPEQIGP